MPFEVCNCNLFATVTKVFVCAHCSVQRLITVVQFLSGLNSNHSPSPHQRAMAHILSRRLSDEKNDWQETTQGAFAYLLLQSIVTPSAPLPALSSYPNTPSTSSKSILCSFLPLIHRVISIRYILSACCEPPVDMKRLQEELLQLCMDLSKWESSLPCAWNYRVISRPRPTSKGEEWPQKMFLFSSLGTMMLWNLFWMTSLNAISCLDTIDWCSVDCSMKQADAARVVDSICYSVPHVNGDCAAINGSQPHTSEKILESALSSRSLRVASRVPSLPEVKKRWISQQLSLLATYKGVGNIA